MVQIHCRRDNTFFFEKELFHFNKKFVKFLVKFDRTKASDIYRCSRSALGETDRNRVQICTFKTKGVYNIGQLWAEMWDARR